MRIVHISDLHLEPAPERRFPGLQSRLEADLVHLRATEPDLFLVTGDLTTYGTSDASHLELARAWLDRLGAPWLALPGNHDLGPSPRRGELFPEDEAWEAVAYADSNYGRIVDPRPVLTRDVGPLRVVAFGCREDDPDNALAELEVVLGQEPDRPVLLAGHYPAVETRTPLLHESFGSSDFVPNTMSRLGELIGRHPHVRLYACGHIHVTTGVPVAEHCLQLTAGGLGPGASTYRVYDVDEAAGELRYTTVLGSGPLEFWEPLLQVPTQGPEFSCGGARERSGTIRLGRGLAAS